MRLAHQVPFLAFAFGAAILTAFVAVRPSPVLAETPEEQIAALKALEKTDEGKCVAKMQELKDSVGDKAVFAAIRAMVSSKSDKVACAAIKMLANTKDPEFYKWLSGKIDDKDLADKKDGRPEVYKAVLESLIPYGEKNKAALGKIEDMIKKFLPTDSEYSTRLIHAYGTVRDKMGVEQLLKWGEETDGKAGGKGGSSGGGGKGTISPETKENYGKARTAIVEALNQMTGQDIADIVTMKKFWTEKPKDWKFPDPNAPPAAAVHDASIVATAAEFKDEAYGFSAKKPVGDNWYWGKADYQADETPRVMLTFAPADDPKNMSARAYFIIHPCKNPPPDVKGMVDWALNSKGAPYKTQLEFDDKHAPKVEEKKLGGADWTVISCKGNGIGNRQGFGSQERRFYFVKIDTNILYIDAVCTLGAEEDVKSAFWACLDNITVPVPKKK